MFEPLEKAETPAEMRAAIEAGLRDSPLIRNVLTAARYEGMSAEDTYTALAYHALQTMVQYQRLCLEFQSIMPPAAVTLDKATLAPSGGVA